MNDMINNLMSFSVYLINILGYPGIFIAGALEFIGLPVSSEVLLPVIGLIVRTTDLDLIIALIAVNLGSIIATMIMYAIGYYFNNWASNFIRKSMPNQREKIDKLSKWIVKNGTKVAFFTRFIPFVRVYVSLLAGIERVPVVGFTLYSLLGIAIWNIFFVLAGYYLGDGFDRYKSQIIQFMYINRYIDFAIAAVVILIIIILFIVFRKYKKKK